MTILVLVLLAIAFCEAQENVALGGVAVSSDDGNTGVFAFDAVDGDEFTCFHIRGELDTDLWWQVDLGGKSVHRIDRVEINTTHNFTGQECGLLLRNFQNVDTNNYVTGFFELMGVKTEDGCCSACLQKDTCEMWRLDSNGCWLYALQDIQWTDGQSIAYRNGDGGHPSIFLYGATVRAGPESGHDLNPNCGEDVSLAHTVDSLLVRHCDQRFGRYVSISSSLGQLKFCEVAVYAEHVNYVDLGCYKDDPNLLSLEENTLVSDLLDGSPSERENAFDKCAFAAQRLQYMVFSLKNGGECFSGPDAGLTCDRSAKLDSCISLDASSIPINLYLIVDTPSEQIFANRYVRIGCYAENADDPTMASLEESHPRLQDNYKQRSLPGRKCASVAAEMNFLIFALHNGGKCLADANGWARYDKYGASDECVKGKGGRHAITVYAIVHTRDTEAPNVSCSDIRQATSPESDIAFVEAESNVQVSDNVDFHGDFTRNCLPSLVDGLGIGSHPVTCSLIDRSGNEASCDFIVTVVDEESPVGSCPDVEEPTLQGSNLGVLSPNTVSATDNVDKSDVEITCTPSLSSTFPFGLSEVKCIFFDSSGNNSTCEFTVTIVDAEPPSVNCSDIANVTLPDEDFGTVSSYSVWATDNVDEENVNVKCFPRAEEMFQTGTTDVQCTFTDGAYNEAMCTFSVVIYSGASMESLCPDDMTIQMPPDNTSFVSVTWIPPSIDGLIVESSFNPGDAFPRGQTEVSYEFSYGTSSVIGHCSFLVNALAPCLLLRPDVTVHPAIYLPHGHYGHVSCHDGWVISADTRLSCTDGALSGARPECTDADECAEDGLNECNFQEENEICLNEPMGSYTCVCRSGYHRDTRGDERCVPIVKGEEVDPACGDNVLMCAAETDDNGITWAATPANCFTAWMKCPSGQYGDIRRTCSVSGTWEDPDTTFCTSEILGEALEKAKEVNSTDEAVELVDETEELLSMRNKTLGGDLLIGTKFLNAILRQYPFSLPGDTSSKISFSWNFVRMVNFLLDMNNEKQWQNIHENLGVNMGSSSVFEELERFNFYAADFIRGVNTTIHLSYPNIEYQAYSLANGVKKMTTLIVDHHEGSRVKRDADDWDVSEAVLPPWLPKNDTNASIVIIYVYHNLGDVLPVGDGQPENDERKWVDTITAIKRIEKVNSPVISVTLYSDSGSTVKLPMVHLKIHHKEEGYSPKCVRMVYDNEKSIWDTEACKLLSTDLFDQVTTCSCDEPGNYGVVTTMGKEPVPFYLAARKAIAYFANGLAILLLIVSIIFVTLSRITTDRYQLLRVSTLSFLLMPTLTIASMLIDSSTAQCKAIAVVLQISHLINLAWIMNMSIEVTLRLAFYIHTSQAARFGYVLSGWLLPLTLMAFFLMEPGVLNSKIVSCWSQVDSTVINTISVPSSVFVAISVLCLAYTHYIYTKEKIKYEPLEWQTFWEELRSVMQMCLAGYVCWISGLYTARTDDLLTVYIHVFSSFVFASVVFLSACATNKEMVTAIKIHFEGDDDFKAALVEVKQTEHARFDGRKKCREEINEMVRLRHKEEKLIKEKKRIKSKQMVNLFSMATKGQDNKIRPSIEEDFSI